MLQLMLYLDNLSLLAEKPVEFQLKFLSQLHPLPPPPLFIPFVPLSCSLLSAKTPFKHRGAPVVGRAGFSRRGTGFNPKQFAAGNVDKVTVTGVNTVDKDFSCQNHFTCAPYSVINNHTV